MAVKKDERDQRPLTDADVVAPLPTGEEEPEAGADAPVSATPGQREPAPSPERVKVKIAGKEFEVEAPLAAALDERETGFSQKLSEQGAELGQLRTTVGNLMATVSTPKKGEASTEPEDQEPVFDYDKYQTLHYENPTEAMKLRDKFDRERMAWQQRQWERNTTKLRTEYQTDQQRRDANTAWERRLDQFYRDNPDLDGEDMLVDGVFKEMASKLRGLSTDEILAKVADESRIRIHRLVTKFGKGKEPPKPTSRGGNVAVVEGGGPVRTGGKPGEEEGEDRSPKTMSEAIRRKQSRHRGAHTVEPRKASDRR